MNTAFRRLISAFFSFVLAFISQESFCLGLDSTPETASPITIVGVASVDQVSEHLKGLAKEVGLETVLQQFLDYIPDSLDPARPFGIVALNGLREKSKIESDLNPELDNVILIPVNDANALVNQLDEMGLIEGMTKKGDVWEFRAPKAGMWRSFAIERDGWLLVVADHRVLFNKIPNSLDKILLPPSEGFDLFATVNPKQLPTVIRNRFRDELTKSLDQLSQSDVHEDTQPEFRATFKREFAEGLINAFDSIKQCNLGVKLLGPEASSIIELNLLLEPTATVSQDLIHVSEAPSLFSRFGYTQEAVRSGIKLRLPKFMADFYAADFTKSMLDERRKDLEGVFVNSEDRLGMTPEAKAKIFNEIISLFSDTLQSGNIDFLTLVGKSPSESVFMFRVVDPKRFENILLELQKTLRNRSELGKIEMNVDKHKGVEIHTALLSNLDSAGNRIVQSRIQPVGDELKIAIGISKEVAMFAIGESPVVELKKALDNTQIPSLGKNRDDLLAHTEISVSYMLSQMVSVGKPNSSFIIAPKANFDDKLKLELKTVPNGLSGRIALQLEAFSWIVSEFPKIVEGLQRGEPEDQENPFASVPKTEDPSSMNSQPSSARALRSQTSRNPSSSIQKPSGTNGPSNSEVAMVPTEPTHTEIARFEDLTWGVKGIDFSPDGRTLAAGKPDQTVVMLDIAKKSKVSMLESLVNLGSAQKCMFTPDGKRLVVGGQSGELAVFSISKNDQMKQIAAFSGHSGEIHCLSISEDGKRAISGDQSKKVFCWDISSGDIIANIGGFDGPIKAVRLASHERIAYATDGSRLVEFDLAKKKIITERKLTASWASSQAAAFAPNGEYVAVGDSYDIRLWNLKSGKELPKLISPEIQWSMQFTPNSEQLLSGGNGRVNLWDVKKSKLSSVQKVIDFVYIQSLAISRDGKLFAVPSNQDLRIFEFKSHQR